MPHLRSLRVIHWAKLGAASSDSRDERSDIDSLGVGVWALPVPLDSVIFHLGTCQRKLWVYDENALAEKMGSISGPERLCAEALRLGAEVYSGSGAYSFLLRFATGLESAVRGETDVFGQLKEAWAQYEQERGHLYRELSPWIQRVFEDTKEIRSQYLQSVGGASYGSLARQLLRNLMKESQTQSDIRPILLVGAGPIAVSVAPWLSSGEFGELWVSNRTPEKAQALAEEVVARQGEKARPQILAGDLESEAPAWRQARAVILAVPLDRERDEKRRAEWLSGTPVLHLGTLRSEAQDWSKYPNFYALDDLFEIQRQAEGVRGDRFTRALRACDERARLRAMGGSISIAHGWEDLAVFL